MSKEQFKNEILAVIYRASQESDLTLREMVEALHESVEHVIFLEGGGKDAGLPEG